MQIRLIVCAFLIARTAIPQEAAPFPETVPYRETARQTGHLQELTLKDALARALKSNLELELETSNRLLARERTRSALGFYDPTLVFSPAWNTVRSPTSSVLQAGSSVFTLRTDAWTANTSLQQNLIGGGNVTVSFNGNKTTTNSSYVFLNPFYSSVFDLRFSQPLWRGFRQTAADHQIRLSRLDERIADAQFRQLAADVVYRVSVQYWQLALAIETHEAIRQARDLAVRQREETLRRVEAGLLSSVAVTSADAEVALRDRDRFQAEVGISSAQNALKNLLAAGPADPIWQLTVLPVDTPDSNGEVLPLADAIAMALARRPDIEQLRRREDQAQIEQRFESLERRPAVNLVLDGSAGGQAGTVISDGSGNAFSDTSAGGPLDSLAQSLSFRYPSWTVGLELRLPLRNRAAQAAFATASINLRRTQVQIRTAEQAVVVDVRNAWEAIPAQKRGLDAAILTRQLSERELAGETERFQAGFSTVFEVLRHQRDLTSARVEELRAKVSYELALTALNRAMDTLIDEAGLVHTGSR